MNGTGKLDVERYSPASLPTVDHAVAAECAVVHHFYPCVNTSMTSPPIVFLTVAEVYDKALGFGLRVLDAHHSRMARSSEFYIDAIEQPHCIIACLSFLTVVVEGCCIPVKIHQAVGLPR